MQKVGGGWRCHFKQVARRGLRKVALGQNREMLSLKLCGERLKAGPGAGRQELPRGGPAGDGGPGQQVAGRRTEDGGSGVAFWTQKEVAPSRSSDLLPAGCEMKAVRGLCQGHGCFRKDRVALNRDGEFTSPALDTMLLDWLSSTFFQTTGRAKGETVRAALTALGPSWLLLSGSQLGRRLL